MAALGISVSSWEAISPLGIGAAAFRQGCPVAVPEEHPLHDAADQFPQDIAYRPAYFKVASLLGSKGIRTMDRTTALAVCTAKLLHERRPTLDEVASERVGFVVGTSTGSIRSISDFTRESLVGDRPFLVNPALFPNTVMNCAAGQCGIWFKAKCVNATIAGGRLSGLLSIKYASQMLRRGYADTLFTGGVEELCPQSAWAHRKLIENGRRHSVPLGEGCAMFTLERSTDMRARGAPAQAEILALQYGRYFDPLNGDYDDPVAGIARCIEEALAQCGVAADEVAVCSLCGSADVGGREAERRAVEFVLGRYDVRVHGEDWLDEIGETYSATFSLALGRLLVSLEEGDAGPRIGVAVVSGDDGHVGCLVIRA